MADDEPTEAKPSWYEWARKGGDAVNPDAFKLARAEFAGLVRPGDTLVFRVHATSKTQFDELADLFGTAVKAKLPGVETLFVANVDQILIYRPGAS